MAETRKPNKLYATHPKNYGKGSRQCRMTGRKGGQGLIRKYGIDMSDLTLSSFPPHHSCATYSEQILNTYIKMAETRKPNKLYATHPKNYGKGSRQCRMTGRKGGQGLIRKYGIDMKRQAFRENAIAMGWVKYS